MQWDENLTGTALSIASTDRSPLRVLAGPGTGKSYAMKRRIMRLLQKDGVDPSRILAVTFTRTAAGDLVKDLRSLGVSGCEKIDAGTLHSFCFRILNDNDVFGHIGREARPILTFEKSKVLKFEATPLLADLDDSEFEANRKRTNRILAFEAAWARLQSEQPGWPSDPTDQKFHSKLLEWLKFHKTMLIGELVPLTLSYLRNNPQADTLFSYDHIVVDEYQDLNKAEQALIDLLAKTATLSIVGDGDQSIYKFRHANPEGIIEFNNARPNTHDVTLSECRRCPKTVVAIADSLIRHNKPGTLQPTLRPLAQNAPGNIVVVQWKRLTDEIAGIADYIHSIVQSGESLSDVLLLCPRKHIGYLVRDRLKEANVPSHCFYNEEILETAEAQEAFALLTLLAKPDDLVSLRFLLGCKSNSYLKGEYRKLRNYCEEQNKTPKEALEQILVGETVPKIPKLISRYKDLKPRLGQLRSLSGESLVNELFPADSEWANGVRDVYETFDEDGLAPKQIHERLRTHVTSPEVPTGNFVHIMSLHKSKGLTAKIVIVMNCVEGLVPYIDRKESQYEATLTEQEQRRLFYVAITRTSKTLVLSSCTKVEKSLAHKLGMKVRGFGRTANAIASKFLNELGPQCPEAITGETWRGKDFHI
ncbi:MAG: ATP-dependent helicase [Myxococcales bacterium]|nr:MAG: ATP-dependent helicase [Myxococcales bacterium]